MRKSLFLALMTLSVFSTPALAEDIEVNSTPSMADEEHHTLQMPTVQSQSAESQQAFPTEHGDSVQHTAPSVPSSPNVSQQQKLQQAIPMDTVEMDANDHWQHDLIMLNMRRDGSGTSWLPLDNPMLMKMSQWKNWTNMVHWSVFADYDNQTGKRGDQGFYSQNWVMATTSSPVRNSGIMQLRAMMSLEPLTVGEQGYPLLFQTGETFRGEPLIDRQHPHDLFMELSAQYYHRLNDNTLLRLYVAPVGEPALGPVAFPHRYSALLIPTSPLGHHMQDSTHIAFGVATAGMIYKNKLQLEGSVFNGKEPDENRYDFDYENWRTAYSGRVTYLPTKNWALQTSYGYLQEPEAHERININRLTSSIAHSKTWDGGWWATTLVWGHNFTTEGPNEDDILIESTVNFLNKNYAFGRIEHSFKHGLFGHDEESGLNNHDSFHITAFSLGLARDLFYIKDIPITLGGMITIHAKPGPLNNVYGNFPMGFHVFLHTNPPSMRMSQHQGH